MPDAFAALRQRLWQADPEQIRYQVRTRGKCTETNETGEGMGLGTKDQITGRAPRILFYSHDTFGLGHLRRSRALASAITQAWHACRR